MPTFQPGDHVHFIGMAGAGMRGLARVFSARGARVTGCDLSAEPHSFEAFEVDAIAPTHDPLHLEDHFGSPVDIVVHTAALPEDHLELEAAHERSIPVLAYSEALGAIFNDATGIAVAGTHGKTTCATMLAVLLEEAGRDPTAVIGGRVQRWNSHARAGDGDLFVAEACEFGGNFHAMEPTHVLLTNVARDHLDCYSDEGAIHTAFTDFLASRSGWALGHRDDAGARSVLADLDPPKEEVSRGDAADWHLQTVEGSEDRAFRLEHSSSGEHSPRLPVPVPGSHQLDNAAEVAIMARRLGLEWPEIVEGLGAYDGVARRFELVRESNPRVIDDYAHHPEEIEATIEAARASHPDRRLLVCFQPHQYERTYHLMGEWAPAFAGLERLWLVDIYGARDHHRAPRVSIDEVAREIQPEVDSLQVFESPDALGDALSRHVADETLVLIMGAGDIERAADMMRVT